MSLHQARESSFGTLHTIQVISLQKEPFAASAARADKASCRTAAMLPEFVNLKLFPTSSNTKMSGKHRGLSRRACAEPGGAGAAVPPFHSHTGSVGRKPRASFLGFSQDLAFGCKEALVWSLQACFAQLPFLHGHTELLCRGARPRRAAASCCSPNKVCKHIKQNHAEPF